MRKQSFWILVQVIIAFSLMLCVEIHQPPAFGEDGTLVRDLWAEAGGSLIVAVGLVFLDLSEHLVVAGKVLVAVGDHWLAFLLLAHGESWNTVLKTWKLSKGMNFCSVVWIQADE